MTFTNLKEVKAPGCVTMLIEGKSFEMLPADTQLSLKLKLGYIPYGSQWVSWTFPIEKTGEFAALQSHLFERFGLKSKIFTAVKFEGTNQPTPKKTSRNKKGRAKP